MNNDCCKDTPCILCRECKTSACSTHLRVFIKNHSPLNVVTANGKDVYDCNGVPVTYITEKGVVILLNPEDLREPK